MNVVVVTTGGGFDYETEVDPHLIPAVVDLTKPLPENPTGVAALEATLAEIAKPSAPGPVEALSETARAITGKTYTFGQNAANIKTLGVDFNETAEAILRTQYDGSNEVISSPIGLDGNYRATPEGTLARGYWADEQTFILERMDVGLITFLIHFDADKVSIQAPELGVSFTGQVE
jgi:hypothetical protein